jgi:hypothetical protein
MLSAKHGGVMDWRRRFIEVLQHDRAQHLSQIELLESGRCQVHEMRDGRFVDTTAEALERTRGYLAEVERLLGEEGVSDA